MNSTLPLVVNGGLVPDGLATAVLRDDETRHRPTGSVSNVPHVRHRDAGRARGRRRLAVCQMRAALGRPTVGDSRRVRRVGPSRPRIGRRVTKSDHIAVTFGDAPVERVDGRP